MLNKEINAGLADPKMKAPRYLIRDRKAEILRTHRRWIGPHQCNNLSVPLVQQTAGPL
jgi:hypothetical protein